MRAKIIAVFTVVVLVVGVLSYALTRAALGDLGAPREAHRALAAASAKLELEGLVLERWLSGHVADPKVVEPFNAGTRPARAEGATSAANAIRDAAASAPELSGISPALVVLVDRQGVVLGRNGSALMRGDDLGAVYPALKAAIEKGVTGSDVWVSRARSEQLLASYAPVRDAEGKVVGALAVGTSLNDERLTSTSERTSGNALVVALREGAALDVVARSNGAPADALAALAASPAKDGAMQALTSGQIVDLVGLPSEYLASSAPVAGYGDGRRAVLISVSKVKAAEIVGALAWPTLGATLIGLLLVAIGAHLLDLYLSRPIAELEDGLLAIMNGRTDLRFEIEHAELGGLVFRLNSLLNQLFGVQEDDTDEQGRPSHAPTATSFQHALEVDERMAAAGPGDTDGARALRDEPEQAYYERIFREYLEAKRSLGDPTDHVVRSEFVARIMASERDLAQRHGRPVRYKVEVRGREVVLLAVPLA
jgi:hypothetical protein